MKHWCGIRSSLTAIAVAAGTAGATGQAAAQVATPAPAPPGTSVPDPFFGGLRPGFPFNPFLPPNGNAFGSPAGAFNPFAGTFDPRFLATANTGFVNGIDPRFSGVAGGSPFFAADPFFFNSFGPTASFFPNAGLGFNPASLVAPPSAFMSSRVPVLGVNVDPRSVGMFRRTAPRMATRVRARSQPSISTPNGEEMRIARRMQSIMRNQPMVPGHVVQVGATGVRVKLDEGGAIRRYALSDVFFYRGERLHDAAHSPDLLQKGEAVLVPESTSTVS